MSEGKLFTLQLTFFIATAFLVGASWTHPIHQEVQSLLGPSVVDVPVTNESAADDLHHQLENDQNGYILSI